MSNKSSDALFFLIRSLTKSEKKNFKLYVTRNSKREDLRTVKLFDILEKMNEYDESKVLQKYSDLPKQQLLNIKSILYNDILSSLRLLKKDERIDIRLHEQMDNASILYGKGLYIQSLKTLEKMRELAATYHQFSYLQQILFFEKKIETLHITRSMVGRADLLINSANQVNDVLVIVNTLSNLSLHLYSWFIVNGHARNEQDETMLRTFFNNNLPQDFDGGHSFYSQLYLYQSHCWLNYILQDFFHYYRYTQKWVDLFEQYPIMKTTEVVHYLKGLHYLADAHFYLRNFRKLEDTIEVMRAFQQSEIIQKNEAYLTTLFTYLSTAEINRHFVEGTFSSGLQLVSGIEENLAKYDLFIDDHRVLIFHYKIACMYFGSSNNETAIDYLNKIINRKTDLRTDLQCYARLLHLIAHYELGNYDLLEYLSKSVYHLMAKMANLSIVEEEVFKFLKKAMRSSSKEIKNEFKVLLEKLKAHTTNPFETRAYSYLDIISWLESKIHNRPVQDVIREKYTIAIKHK